MEITQQQFLDQALGARNRLELWERILQQFGIRTMAEVGVWKGEYAEAMLAHCASIEKYFMIDP